MTGIISQPISNSPNPYETYHRAIRFLHWAMAAGFVFMWFSGVFVTNIEGFPFWAENDRQGVVRDLHKSVGLTLLGLLVVRFGLRLFYKPPSLPERVGPTERRLATMGHLALYGTVVAASLTGLAIADVHEYGNAYFGIALPQMFPVTDTIAGFSSTPWAYVIHAVFAYGLLVLVIGHVASVVLHRTMQKVDLLPRILPAGSQQSGAVLRGLTMSVTGMALLVSFLAVRAIVTIGPLEEPRDYITTTPFVN